MQPSELTSHPISEEELKNLYVYVTKRKEGNISFCEYYPISKKQLVYKKDGMYVSLSDDAEEYILSLRSRLSQREEECRRYEEVGKQTSAMLKALEKTVGKLDIKTYQSFMGKKEAHTLIVAYILELVRALSQYKS